MSIVFCIQTNDLALDTAWPFEGTKEVGVMLLILFLLREFGSIPALWAAITPMASQ